MPSNPTDQAAKARWWCLQLADSYDGTPRQWVLLGYVQSHFQGVQPYVPGRGDRVWRWLSRWLGQGILTFYLRKLLPDILPLIRYSRRDWSICLPALEAPILAGTLLGSLLLTGDATPDFRRQLFVLFSFLAMLWLGFRLARLLSAHQQLQQQQQITQLAELEHNPWEEVESLEDGLKHFFPAATVSHLQLEISRQPAYWLSLERLPILSVYRPNEAWPWREWSATIVLYALICSMQVLAVGWSWWIAWPVLLGMAYWQFVLPATLRPAWWHAVLVGSAACAGIIMGWMLIK
ncbi:hypothetical protein [Leeia oryzae]|uniref:hypothetical protein n=1 Tax=Leeia oryzae TaxID=356662 RepID=UPI0012EA9771|nr:hypothetical protein [Leeia oryzae]